MRLRIQQLQRLETLSKSHIPRTLSQSSRLVHSSSRRRATASHEHPASQFPSSSLLTCTASKCSTPPLARLPTSTVLRSYVITRLSSSPALLTLCFTMLQRMLDSKSYLFSLERNPALAKILKSTFYAQFCAGENKKEVTASTAAARDALGYDGIILEYALEVLGGTVPTEAEIAQEIEVWRTGMLASIEVAREGDFIGLKWSGLGRHALQLMKDQQNPTPEMWSAMLATCDAAAAKNVALLPSAEEESWNPGYEKWTLSLQKLYNTPEQGRAVLYTTYQCYLKAISKRLAENLAKAQKEGYIAGVKLVRGAYLNSEPRHLIWETKEGTDANYDACAEAVLTQRWNTSVPAPSSAPDTPFPAVNIVLATHNLASVQKAQAIRAAQLASSPSSASLPRLTYAQLQGMADEISQELVQDPAKVADVNSKVVKCMTWGTTTQCLNYLMRRASENKEAASRTSDTRRAMGRELFRRFKAGVGFT